MTPMKATHTISGVLAAEVFPRTFVAADGVVFTRTSAAKWGGYGLDIEPYAGSDTVEVSDAKLAKAEEWSEVEARLVAESSEE